jgi:hypothetical protein
MALARWKFGNCSSHLDIWVMFKLFWKIRKALFKLHEKFTNHCSERKSFKFIKSVHHSLHDPQSSIESSICKIYPSKLKLTEIKDFTKHQVDKQKFKSKSTIIERITVLLVFCRSFFFWDELKIDARNVISLDINRDFSDTFWSDNFFFFHSLFNQLRPSVLVKGLFEAHFITFLRFARPTPFFVCLF